MDAISEVKHATRITRRNSLTMTVETEKDALSEKSPDTKMENASDKTSEDEIKLEEKQSNIKLLNSDESSGNLADCSAERNASSNLKRTRTNDKEKSSCDSPPVKKKPEDKDSSEEEVFEVEASENTKIQQASTTATDDTSGPDLTCSEQLPTTCSSPDPYVGGFPNTEGYLEDCIKDAKKCMGTKDKDSSSSLDEKKHEKHTTSRRGKCRRERKGRTLSSYSSFESTDLPNGTTTAPSVTVMLSPSWTPRYNFTEDLEELLKNEESSERIRLLTEKIKDIRKVYGELKSELANIDRKKKRRLKRKREEELSAEENTTRSSSSSPLATTNAVTSSNPPAAVECR